MIPLLLLDLAQVTPQQVADIAAGGTRGLLTGMLVVIGFLVVVCGGMTRHIVSLYGQLNAAHLSLATAKQTASDVRAEEQKKYTVELVAVHTGCETRIAAITESRIDEMETVTRAALSLTALADKLPDILRGRKP